MIISLVDIFSIKINKYKQKKLRKSTREWYFWRLLIINELNNRLKKKNPIEKGDLLLPLCFLPVASP